MKFLRAVLRTWLSVCAVLIALLPAHAATEAKNGLTLTITAGGTTDVLLAPNVWLYVPAGEPPSPFIPPGPFTAKWEGSVSADLRGNFTFHAALSGTVKVTVNGELALEANDSGDQPVAGKSVRLNKGTNALTVDYTSPATGDAFLRLYWTNRETPLNPIPLTQLTPAAGDALNKGLLIHEGRDLVLELRCTQCHSAPGLAADPTLGAPRLDGIGSRRQADWMARWILDPQALRPGTPMPKVFQGPNAAAEAKAVAAYLASLQSPTPIAPTTGDVSAGKALFEKFHCVACHVEPGGSGAKPGQISHELVKAKFTPGALAAFLRKPEEHFAGIRMPNFKLSNEEAANLAAYLDSIAAPATPAPPSTDAALIAEGKNLMTSRGCLNCHSLDGAKSTLTAAPLASLVAGSWNKGCVAESPSADSKAPQYTLDAEARAALQAFAATDRASLARSTSTDFLSRQSQHLNCRGCHGQFEGFPAWELLYGKLKPEWAARFIAGEETWKPRPWNEARMPAFPAYAKGLAAGLATTAGLSPTTAPDPAPANAAELAEAGRKLTSANGGFSCISCHGVGEFGATQVFEAPGINLAHSYARLQPDYFRRWLRAPTMIDSTTKMPVYFDEEGKSPLPDILGGDGPKTIQAVWEYLRLGNQMPKPE